MEIGLLFLLAWIGAGLQSGIKVIGEELALLLNFVSVSACLIFLCFILFVGTLRGQNNPPPPMPDHSWFYMNIDSLYKACAGQKYVPFDISTIEGKRMTNSTCLGKVTFINFWFEGCAPCRGEFGELNRLYDSLKGNPDYEFVAITFDDRASLPAFVQKNNIRYPVATVEDQKESKRLDYRMGYPNSIILDKQGRVAYIGMAAIAENDEKYKVLFDKVLSIMRAENARNEPNR